MRKLKIVACLMAALIAVVNVSAKDKLKVVDPSDYEISGAGSGTG